VETSVFYGKPWKLTQVAAKWFCIEGSRHLAFLGGLQRHLSELIIASNNTKQFSDK
jgi:hypothetical protein